jgi:RND family efflux transporter MFP subunit
MELPNDSIDTDNSASHPKKIPDNDAKTNQNNALSQSTSAKRIEVIMVGLIILILTLLFLIGLFPRLHHWNKLEKAADFTNLIYVNIMTLQPSQKPIQLTLPSTTQAHRITPIWSRINGYVKNFYVDIGDHVEEGQLMLEIYTPEVEEELSQARADLSTSLAKLDITKISASRWQDLFDTNSEAVSPQEVDEKISTFQAVVSEVESVKANVQRLEKICAFNKLYAPFKGIIIERKVDIGSLITAGSQTNYQQLFQIAKTDIIRVFVNVPQSYFRLIKIGGEADILIQEFPERVFKGTIARTSKSLDPLARTLLTEIHVDNKDGDLIIGLYAEVYINLISESPYYIIPTTSLIIRDGPPQVAVIDDHGKVRLESVKIGRDFGKTIEITSGLKEMEKIITNPTEQIHDGIKINLENSIQELSVAK